ncbi:ATPase-like protein [Methanocaldococcus vulcanius M7]|uniref:ATPase-like protein n=1 Tax=Methanocaldococcus vulcanius (strain ATCC 700851 / DSM 12094 / M7) TaxID=579137 RepID=C9RH94_METVM|nr:selenouridine synthase SelU-like subunit [Methanocaldococcus vulcanius]ACX72946.1 ATPase-like protein [Methanocaldococcus vulcanius M7]
MIIFGLFGKTGCGKTEILQELKKKHPVIDIEEIARTRGSVLGDLYHLNMRDQEEFSKIINEEIERVKKIGYVVVEYEGRKIGGEKKLKIPDLLGDIKNYTYKILIDCPYECQIKRLISIYKPKNEEEKKILLNKFEILKNSFKKPEMIETVNKIIELIKEDNYYESAKLIEEKLYREHYLRNVRKINPDLVVYNENISESVKIIDSFIKEKLKLHNII